MSVAIARAGRASFARCFVFCRSKSGASSSRQLALRSGGAFPARSWQRYSPTNGRSTPVSRYSTLAPAASTTTPGSAAPSSPKYEGAIATGGYAYAGIPGFSDLAEKQKWQLEHMAGAFRVFARMGFTEGASGHISVRDPIDPDTFWINP